MSLTTNASSASTSPVLREAGLRRTFAIISHPDAGKTTLTEKFLLYAGAIGTAGGTQGSKAVRSARSDWQGMEQERGISISSAVLRFGYRGHVFNLLDTPGHRDFSEDTYRVLSGVDAAVMVIDGARGVEPQTLKLFEICKRRGTPLITFVNKMDRPTPDPLAIIDDIEAQIGLRPTPVTWPVRPGGRFEGVIDRRDDSFHRYTASARGGSRQATDEVGTLEDVRALSPVAIEELELLDAMEADHDADGFAMGLSTPVFFGSALSNFGVEVLLDAVCEIAPPPAARLQADGGHRELDSPFSGLVFKVQANMDPRHRDRIAFLRICSGRFERGMTLTCERTGRTLAAKYVHEVLGRERDTVDEAYPGDIIGLVNATDLRIGDSLFESDPVAYPPMPTFTPEHFRVAVPADRSRVKQFRRGLEQLDEEGVIQVLRREDLGDQAPIIAAVGVLQFEVASWRLENEFGSPVRMEATSRGIARRTDDASAAILGKMREVEIYRKSDDTAMALFGDRFQLERIQRDHPELVLDVVVNG